MSFRCCLVAFCLESFNNFARSVIRSRVSSSYNEQFSRSSKNFFSWRSKPSSATSKGESICESPYLSITCWLKCFTFSMKSLFFLLVLYCKSHCMRCFNERMQNRRIFFSMTSWRFIFGLGGSFSNRPSFSSPDLGSPPSEDIGDSRISVPRSSFGVVSSKACGRRIPSGTNNDSLSGKRWLSALSFVSRCSTLYFRMQHSGSSLKNEKRSSYGLPSTDSFRSFVIQVESLELLVSGSCDG